MYGRVKLNTANINTNTSINYISYMVKAITENLKDWNGSHIIAGDMTLTAKHNKASLVLELV